MARAAAAGDEGPLTKEEMDMWRAFRSWTESIVADVSADLSSETDMSVADCQVLVRLGESPAGKLGQLELGESLMWSPSRLSHQLSRMSHRGLVSRTSAGTGRLMTIALTPEGRRALEPAQAAHGRAVRKHFLNRVDQRLLRELLAHYQNS
jgi:DNA-binding MarR family transcriptional regulator